MKIVLSVQTLYNSHFAQYTILKKKVDEIIHHNKADAWHYIGRLKELESFALKIETGRFDKDEIFEDFFACTLVVQNLKEIEAAILFIKTHFNIKKQRPISLKFTHKESYSFPFDDLRTYVTLKDFGLGDLAPELYEIPFEIQVKTFLQHAWGIATHDLIYKSDMINWSKERVAYQVKAALEHAEVSISGVEELSKLSEISKENRESKKVNQMIVFLNRQWKTTDLPNDKRRLAQNIISLIDAVDITQSELSAIIVEETAAGRGTNTRNLSPYLVIVQSIFNVNQNAIVKFLRSKTGSKQKILLTKELTLPTISKLNKSKLIDLRF